MTNSFLGKEDRVTKSGGPVTTLHLFVVKASYEIICLPAKTTGEQAVSFTGSKICKRRWWRGIATFLSQGSCAALRPASPGIDVGSFSHRCQQPERWSGQWLSKVWLFICCDFLENSAGGVTEVFHKIILGAGENKIPTLHLCLSYQALLPTRWSVLLGILHPCLSSLEGFSCELRRAWSEVRG